MAINPASPPMFAVGTKLTPEQFNQWMATEYTGGMDPTKYFQTNYNRPGPMTYAEAVERARNSGNLHLGEDNPGPAWQQQVARLTDGSGPAGDGGYRVRYSVTPDGQITVDENDYTGGYAAQELDEANTFNLGEFLTKSAIAGFTGWGAAPMFGAAGSLAAGAGGGAVAGGLNAAMNEQNILKGALKGGLGGAASAGLGQMFGGTQPNILTNGEGSLDSLYADGLGGQAPSGGFQWTPDASITSNVPNIDSGIDYDSLFGGNQMGSDLSFNGMPGAVDGEGLSFGGGTTTGLSGEGTGSGLSFGDATLSAPSGQGFNGTIQTNLANAPTATPSPFENGLGTGIPQTTATVAATGLGTLGLESAVPGTGFLASGAPASTSVWDKIVNGASTAGNNFIDNITTGKGALTAAGGLFSLYNGIQNSNALKDAASAATAGSDPFKTERAKYQKLLSDSYTNPLGSAENQGLMQMYQQTARRQAAAAGVRSNPIHQNIGMSTAMLGQLNDQRKTLANLAGAQFDPATGFKTGSDLLSNSLSARNNGYGDALFSLAKLFGDK